ncbi:MAG TPA: hypothetical protein VFH34_06470 [Anaerolineales bacterium]|nr:hypothetical protein [Anaerolineales bacterium]
MLTDELLNYLFDGKPHPLTAPMKSWLSSSRRFTGFVTSFRNKIRKKLRVTQDRETLYDLQLELETAFLLLEERSLSVMYEPEQNRQVRSPDFAVTFTTSLTFMVEVTRLRALPTEATISFDNGSPIEPERLTDAICSKLGQFLPNRGNVLIVGMDEVSLSQSDLQAVMLRLQQRAERNVDPVFWKRYGFRDRAGFFQHYHRLSEVLVRRSQLQGEQSTIGWINPQAKQPLPGKVRTALHRSHSRNVQ